MNPGPGAGPQAHGSIPYRELRRLGLRPSEIIDVSATVNPWPLPPRVSEKIAEVNLAHYPDNECREAVEALASFHDIPPEWIACTAGMTEAIFILPCIHRKALTLGPTYGDYAAAFDRHQAPVRRVPFPRNRVEFDAVPGNVREESCSLVMVCNPNNPTGDYLPPEDLRELCEALPGVTVCVDESYQEMGESCETALGLVSRYRNLLVLKSLTKPFGIGGIRAAYAVSSGSAVEELRGLRLPWAVSTIAQAVVLEIPPLYEQFRQQWSAILREKRKLKDALRNLGVEVHDGRCPFMLLRTESASQFRRTMLEDYHIAVRDCSSFGMPDMVRIMPSTPERNRRLVEAVAARIPDS